MSNVTEIRTTLNLPAELAEAVDDYWHAERFNSRNGAIRDLLTYAINAKRPPTGWRKPAKEPRR